MYVYVFIYELLSTMNTYSTLSVCFKLKLLLLLLLGEHDGVIQTELIQYQHSVFKQKCFTNFLKSIFVVMVMLFLFHN